MKQQRLLFARTGFVIFCGFLFVLMMHAGFGQSPWAPLSLSPVQRFERTSSPGDVDEGAYFRLGSFLAREFSEDQRLGVPGADAPAQPLRRHPYGIALSRDETKLYVTAPGNEAEPGSTVLVIDTETNRLLREIPVGTRPFGISPTPSGRFLVVTNQYSNYLSVIDSIADAEVQRIPAFFYAQKIAFVAERGWMLVTNRALDSLDVYAFQEPPFSAVFLFRIDLSVANRPFLLDNDPGYGLGGEHEVLIGPAPGFSNMAATTPRELVRTLTNVNPRDLAIAGKYVYVANVNGLGVSIVDLEQRRQAASIDLNAPALDVVAYGSYVFISTLGRFIQGFDDVHNELAVIDTRRDPFSLTMRYTSAPLPPYGPPLGPGRGELVPPSGNAPYLTAFGVVNFKDFPRNRNVFLQIVDGFQSNPDNLPMIVDGALPDQMITINDRLVVADSASDQIEIFSIDASGTPQSQILRPFNRSFTNATQTAFPPAIDHRALVDDPPYLLGKANPDFFSGRMPQEMVFAAGSRKLYVANRLGESIAVFRESGEGFSIFERSIDLTSAGSPPFPATLAEVGEDFYTTSRVSLNRDNSCSSCHPDANMDTKIWHVGSTPGRSVRRTLTNRNLRDTAPFYRSGIRQNLETFRGTFRAMAPEGPFGFFESPVPFDANGDGILNDQDRGRTIADVNRNRMFVLERTGVGFEKTSAAIAAFLESEPRQLPNPFLTASHELSPSVPMGRDTTGYAVTGDAVEGKRIFMAARCPSCHLPPVYTTNEVLSLSKGTMSDENGDGIPDGVTLSFERTLFDRIRVPWERYVSTLPRERLPFTSIDTDRRLHFANTANNFTPAERLTVPRSPWSGRLLVGWTSDTRNINVPSLRGLWDIGAVLQHGRAVDLISVQTIFNNIGKHGDTSSFGAFDPARPWTNSKYLNLAAFLKSIE